MPASLAPLCRAFNAETEALPGERAVIGTINTDSVDRYKTVIVPAGGDLRHYRENPVVLLNHDPERQVGRNQWITIRSRRMKAKTVFMAPDLSEEADRTYRKYQSGDMRGFSISFDPDLKESGPPTKREIEANPHWEGARVIYRKWELIEYSAVTVPGNPEALAEAVSRGWALPEWADEAPIEGPVTLTQLPNLPPLIGRTPAQVLAEIKRNMRPLAEHMLREAISEAQDLLRGKV